MTVEEAIEHGKEQIVSIGILEIFGDQHVEFIKIANNALDMQKK